MTDTLLIIDDEVQIRRLLEALGVKVLRLVRIAIGPVSLGDLGKGMYRHLTQEEKGALTKAVKRVNPDW